jgi:hypothetical protein
MFAEPKLGLLGSWVCMRGLYDSVDLDLQDTIRKTAAVQKPLIDEADARREEDPAGNTVHEALCHDDLHSLCGRQYGCETLLLASYLPW